MGEERSGCGGEGGGDGDGGGAEGSNDLVAFLSTSDTTFHLTHTPNSSVISNNLIIFFTVFYITMYYMD